MDVFFVISGYLITSIILKDCEAGSFSLLRFYQRRIARIFPAFFTVALATLAGASFIYSPQDLASAGANLVSATLSLANIKYMLQGNYFEISPDAQPFLHYWSLSVEEQFYMFFPLLFMLLFRYARRHLVRVLCMLGLGSLIACVLLTAHKPVWAFYLLPTRAWELCAGCLLAVTAGRQNTRLQDATDATDGGGTARGFVSSFRSLVHHFGIRHAGFPLLGILLILLSCFVIQEGTSFPGWLAILPVAGSAGVILPAAARDNPVERLLGRRPMVLVGRMSYSLYLWHWPIYSLVDYRLYLAPEPVRLLLKIGLTIATAALCFFFLENPARIYLNQWKARPIAFAVLAAAVAVCVPLGAAVRRSNYINATDRDIARGGLVFDHQPNVGTVVLMGDSNGSMYGKALREVCFGLGRRLNVISEAAGDPLPSFDGKRNPFWEECLSVIEHERPAVLVFACHWSGKIGEYPERLTKALEAVKPYVGRVVLLNQPPTLPANANRTAIRNGARPPFFEGQQHRTARTNANRFLAGLRAPGIEVLDVAAAFERGEGEVLFLDEGGRLMYQDGSHLSHYGAERIRQLLRDAIGGSGQI